MSWQNDITVEANKLRTACRSVLGSGADSTMLDEIDKIRDTFSEMASGSSMAQDAARRVIGDLGRAFGIEPAGETPDEQWMSFARIKHPELFDLSLEQS